MQQHIWRRARGLMALVVLGALAAGPALAQGRGQNQQGRGQDQQGRGQDQQGRGHDQRNNDAREQVNRDRNRGDSRSQARFDDRHRKIIHNYYEAEMRRGRCPPGIARKHNGCVPPGHARRYVIGRPLPREVIFYEVPQPIAIDLGPPPRGYRYVRVSNDILMLALGTGLVVDALQNLGSNR